MFGTTKLVFKNLSLLLPLAMVAAPSSAEDTSSVVERAHTAAAVLDEMMSKADSEIPQWLLDEAEAVAVIPHVVKGAVGVGGRHGQGLVSQKLDAGWSGPVYLTLSGVSYGVQLGVSATDIVLVFTEQDGLTAMLEDHLKLGADVAVAAGPLGRSAEAGTNLTLDSGVYAYSRSKGLFVGAAFDGAVLQLDDDANELVYGEDFRADDVLNGRTGAPKGVKAFVHAVANAQNLHAGS